jgi:hypothetical protein
MRPNHFGIHMVDRFLTAPIERRFESLKPESRKPPMLYLKCWGSDYPYLQGLEQQKRCLPVPVDSAAEHLIRRSSMLFGSK